MSPREHSRIPSRTGARRAAATPAAQIADAVRARILDGSLAPGERLPTHLMIEKEFGSTSPTVIKAMDVLRAQGFIRSERRRGVFVAERPPHRHQYALAMEFADPSNISQFYVAMRNEAARFASAGKYFTIFYGIGDNTRGGDYQRLLGFVKSHQLAGLIFAQSAHAVANSPLLHEPNIPRVVVATESQHNAEVPAVYPDLASFIPKALDYLASRGRKRVAALMAAVHPTQTVDEFITAAAALGLECRPHWVQGVHPAGARWAKNLTTLLMHDADRPDGLVILDDNLVEHATAGLAATELSIPRDLDVVAHTNFPWPTPAAVPVRRLGYDVRRLLELCIERIESIRRNDQPPDQTLLPALFEEELSVRSTLTQTAGAAS